MTTTVRLLLAIAALVGIGTSAYPQDLKTDGVLKSPDGKVAAALAFAPENRAVVAYVLRGTTDPGGTTKELLLEVAESKLKDKDLELLQGTWNIDTMAWGGKSLPKELMNGYKFVFAGNKLTWDGAIGMQSVMGNVMAIDGTFPCDFKIDPGKEPKQIDMTLHLKKGDRTVLGIYEIKGDTLKVCYFGSNTGKRPAEFSTKDDRNIGYHVLTRAKK